MQFVALALAAVVNLSPNGEADMTDKFVKAVKSDSEIRLEEGAYHFYNTSAKHPSFYISNHDQPIPRTVQLPIEGVKNFKVRGKGKGAKFVFHGESLGILLMDTSDVVLENISVDWAETTVSESRITAIKPDGELETEWVVKGCYGAAPIRMLWDKDTKSIVPETGDWFRKEKAKVGDFVSYRTGRRPEPAICLYRANRTKMDKVFVHAAHGMGVLGQRSSDIAFLNGGVCPREGSICSTTADATHFSNCRGKIIFKNSYFAGMMDDAINVHCTCLRIEEKLGENKFRCRYVHGQSIGFETFAPGETLRFIRANTLENGSETKVVAFEMPDPRTAIITVEDAKALAGYEVGDAVENADWQPSVVFSGNKVANNRARGTLFTTNKPVLVENNLFDHVSGSAILLAGDAAGWYESGACRDVTIRGNTFVDCLTSGYQFCDAVITAYPMVKDLKAQKSAYHANITVEKNVFKCPGKRLQSWISTDNVVWRDNVEK